MVQMEGAFPTIVGVDPQEIKRVADNVPPMLVEGLVPSQAVVMLAGQPGIGKSFVALSMCASIAEGTPWFDLSTGEPRKALYVLGEGYAQVGRRVRAWERLNERQMSDGVQFVDGAGFGIDLTNEERASALLAFVETEKPGIVVLDTFAMLARVESENDNAGVGNAMRVAHQIVQRTGTAVMFVHHVAKESGKVRGATAFRGNADTVIVAKRDERDGTGRTFLLSTEGEDDGKQRDSEAVREHGFEVVSFGPGGVLARVHQEPLPAVARPLDDDAVKQLEARGIVITKAA